MDNINNKPAEIAEKEDGAVVYVSRGTIRHQINQLLKAARAKAYAAKLARGRFVNPAGTKKRKQIIRSMFEESRTLSSAGQQQKALEAKNRKKKSRRKHK